MPQLIIQNGSDTDNEALIRYLRQQVTALKSQNGNLSGFIDPITGGITNQFPVPGSVPQGVTWSPDTISGIDIYAQGFVQRPTIFFDPTATNSLGKGTFLQPYTTQAQLQYACSGNMAGQVLGVKRGTRLGTTGNGLTLTAYGSSGAPFYIVPYGDATPLPIITGGLVVTSWALVSGNIWQYTQATETDAWQNNVRLQKKAWSVSAANTLTTDGTATWNGGVLYIRPYAGENPNLGQMEVSQSAFALSILYSDVAATGNIIVAGMDVRKGYNSSMQIKASGVTTITSCGNIIVAGNRFSNGGTDSSNASGNDAMVVYGPSTTVRASGVQVIGNYVTDAINNAYEYSFVTGLIHDSNVDMSTTGYGATITTGGNHVELWASCDTTTIRRSYGENHTTSGKVNTAPHAGGVWATIYTNSAADPDHTKCFSNTVEFCVFKNMSNQGVEIQGGTGNVVRHNTFYQDQTASMNRLLNFAANANANGTCSCEITNNVTCGAYVGNITALETYVGAAVVNAVGKTLNSTLTGDNNYYTQWNAAGAQIIRFNGTNYNPGTFATYQAAVAPFDAHSVLTANTVNGAAYFDADLTPSTTAPFIGTGKTGLTYRIYKDGTPYNSASSTIGAYQS